MLGGDRTLPLGLLHVAKDPAGYLGGTYVIGSISQGLLAVLYFVPPRLIHRFVQPRIWSRSACILAVRVGSSGPEEPREAGLSGPAIIKEYSAETEPNSLNDCAKCTAGLFIRPPRNHL
jgi:hypothetical protein